MGKVTFEQRNEVKELANHIAGERAFIVKKKKKLKRELLEERLLTCSKTKEATLSI